MTWYYRMAFECDQPGCTYSASTRSQLAQHRRTRHPGARPSAGHTRYRLGKARETLNNARSFGRSIFSGHSRLWKLPKNVIGIVASSLTGKKGSFNRQVREARNNVTQLARNLSGRGGGRRTRRKGRSRSRRR